MVFFSVGWTPLQPLYPSEVLAFENRTKGLALQGICTNIASLINTFALPTALLKLGWKSESYSYRCFPQSDCVRQFSIPHLCVLGYRWSRNNLLFRRRDETAIARRFGCGLCRS